MLRHTLLVLAMATMLAACGKGGKDPKAEAAKPVILQIAPEDVMRVSSNSLVSGPVITGSVQPERKADLRAEVSAVVLQVLKENGDPVKKGDILVKLDETSIRDSLGSSEASSTAASQSLQQAERQLERLKTLRASGMTSMQSLDDAEMRRNSAQSELAGARARTVQARQQLQRTLVRAPFDGVVSERKVSAGDTAAIGKELLKVIDPTSMRFEGRVSADRIAAVKVGQSVNFRVNGYGEQEFQGVVRRIDPAANDVTRQVEVLVGFVNHVQPKVAGLYGEGRIDSDVKSALMLPEAAVVKAGDKVYVWRLQDKTISKVNLEVGVRDARTGNYEVKSGLAAGDQVLRTPSSTFKDGQQVELMTPKLAAAAAAVAVQRPTLQGK
ncbi:efflux RND transporter periplasmic adaptor subunit [Massilia sp. PWRC2]|uniref:efflux RND transporter periplasmic adaptor subunit n=1 Tax=Massilia sp. PWRC2 TaxID=2804626 RepID=UPI003CE8A119